MSSIATPFVGAVGERKSKLGTNRLLYGIILGALGLWLFAQTIMNISPVMARDLGIETSVMNIAVSIATLLTGVFVAVMGGLADRLGRVRTMMIGFVITFVGSVLIAITPAGGMAEAVLMAGRIAHGIGGAFIFPASLALVKAYWEGAERQRAISMWSIGAWGGNGFSALFGGLMAENVGWRWIFVLGAVSTAIGFFMVLGTPENRVESQKSTSFDYVGVSTFVVMMASLQIALTQGGQFGWVSPLTLGLVAIAIILGVVFVRTERGNPGAFIDFRLFRNNTYAGATISNFLLNTTIGILVVAMALMQGATTMTAQEAGFLTIGYAVVIVSFIRVGEKLLQRFGPKRPMLWGTAIVGVSIVLLMPTNVMTDTYTILATIAFSLFGLGLAFYATPCTDAALNALPEHQAGSGAGIFKMASSLGASFGVAISATIFTVMGSSETSAQWLEGLVAFEGRQDNLALREAALMAYAFNLLMVVLTYVVIHRTVPNHIANADTQVNP